MSKTLKAIIIIAILGVGIYLLTSSKDEKTTTAKTETKKGSRTHETATLVKGPSRAGKEEISNGHPQSNENSQTRTDTPSFQQSTSRART